jgi:hypothetical protein
MSIHPVRRPRVALHLELLDDAGGRLTTFHDGGDLGARHRVTLDGRGVVDVIEPDFSEDVVGLHGAGKAPKALMEETNLFVEGGQDLFE